MQNKKETVKLFSYGKIVNLGLITVNFGIMRNVTSRANCKLSLNLKQ